MRFFIVIGLVLFCATGAVAQIPRASTGIFEYTGKITSVNALHLKERAKSFFSQPFLIHWDSVSQAGDMPGVILLTGTGYIKVRAKQHGVSMPSPIPVLLRFCIEIKNGFYRYTVNHFMVNAREGRVTFPLEQKPDSVKSIVYDQLVQNTHRQMSFVIGWMKRYMQGEE